TERLTNYKTAVAKKEEAGDLLKPDNPVARKLVHVMERVEALIDSAFSSDSTGKLSPRDDIKVKSVEELTKLIDAHRKYLETYHRFVATYMPANESEKRELHIREFNLHMDNVPQEDRIDMLKGITHGNEPRGDKQPTGGVQEADFTEVPERGDED
ncbi:MAG: peroxisomal biogenesis factor 3, partial [Candidatus Bathyarchaeota archaeon]|nr:peroxisomal biogenesis factor 3 [Candidatus Bathyarchaeota archaeon]